MIECTFVCEIFGCPHPHVKRRRENSMSKVKYISVYHFCGGHDDAEYHVSFNRGKDARETPTHKGVTSASIKRVAGLFYDLEWIQPTFQTNFTHLQAFTKGE